MAFETNDLDRKYEAATLNPVVVGELANVADEEPTAAIRLAHHHIAEVLHGALIHRHH
jgi:hypothetical protein